MISKTRRMTIMKQLKSDPNRRWISFDDGETMWVGTACLEIVRHKIRVRQSKMTRSRECYSEITDPGVVIGVTGDSGIRDSI